MASVILWPKNPEFKEQERFNVMDGDIRYIRNLYKDQPRYEETHPWLIQPIIAKGSRFEGVTARF